MAGALLKVLTSFHALSYILVSVLFGLASLALIGLAGWGLFRTLLADGMDLGQRVARVLDSVATLTISVASLELSQTIMEEEVLRSAQISAPTRVRRFLSRFLAVIVVALSIEALVTVFRLSHEAPEKLPHAAAVAGAAALLLAGWGVFIHLNRSAEELEPEAMEEAKREDRALSPDA